jgi:hypothetical protein
MIAVFIPIYNNAAWCRDVVLPEGFTYYAVDNASTDDSAAILEQKGVTVFRNPHNIGRVGNWQRCIEIFLDKTTCDWFKWLFAGDSLYANAAPDLNALATDFPAAKMLIAAYHHREHEKNITVSPFAVRRSVDAREALRLVATTGNWFGSPIGHAFHRGVIAKGLPFSALPWVADMLFCLEIATHTETACLPTPIGCFNTAARQYYTAQNGSISAICEEGIAREQAIQRYAALTNDAAAAATLRDALQHSTRNVSLYRHLKKKSFAGIVKALYSDAGLVKIYAKMLLRSILKRENIS